MLLAPLKAALKLPIGKGDACVPFEDEPLSIMRPSPEEEAVPFVAVPFVLPVEALTSVVELAFVGVEWLVEVGNGTQSKPVGLVLDVIVV